MVIIGVGLLELVGMQAMLTQPDEKYEHNVRCDLSPGRSLA